MASTLRAAISNVEHTMALLARISVFHTMCPKCVSRHGATYRLMFTIDRRHISVTGVIHTMNFTSSQWHAIFDHLVVALSPTCPTTLVPVTTESQLQYFSVLDSPSRTSTSQSANCGMLGDNQRSAPNVWYCLGGVVAKIGKSSMPSRPDSAGPSKRLPNTSSAPRCSRRSEWIGTLSDLSAELSYTTSLHLPLSCATLT
ncbi:hypothetical protein FIBSPDRAFT_35031 [Athelia psychrophila]|uniref:Uncharacterized protein n=1 Tax=Athelia psychrophila TaxID=1759441 RepID=A0A166FWD0_9AGAM|nr:hypothetical protein FIBSPDRAFT_35031 [Fibularhizoctonia sp. CBS 109695]